MITSSGVTRSEVMMAPAQALTMRCVGVIVESRAMYLRRLASKAGGRGEERKYGSKDGKKNVWLLGPKKKTLGHSEQPNWHRGTEVRPPCRPSVSHSMGTACKQTERKNATHMKPRQPTPPKKKIQGSSFLLRSPQPLRPTRAVQDHPTPPLVGGSPTLIAPDL